MSALEDLLGGLRAAGERTRLRLLFLLSHGEFNVKELTQILGQSQPRISRHLKLMAEAGLLERYREGSWVMFRLAGDGTASALARMIVDLVPANDPAVKRDLERFEEIREIRARAAAEYFRTNAGAWDRIRSLHLAEAEVEAAMRAAFGDDRADTFLDLGTGTGRMLELFADRFRQGIGIDASQAMLAVARANLERAGLRHCQVRHGDILHLPYDNASADAIVIHQVLHYLEEPGRAVQEATRVLKPGGRLLVADFAPHELEFLREHHAHRRLGIATETLEGWAARAGLSLVRHRSLPPGDDTDGEGLTVSLWLLSLPRDPAPVRSAASKRKETLA